jgi:hypothetical protein
MMMEAEEMTAVVMTAEETMVEEMTAVVTTVEEMTVVVTTVEEMTAVVMIMPDHVQLVRPVVPIMSVLVKPDDMTVITTGVMAVSPLPSVRLAKSAEVPMIAHRESVKIISVVETPAVEVAETEMMSMDTVR